jgi:hypothetical protein
MPFPKDALQVILAYITQHTGTVGDVLRAVLDVLNWLVTTFTPTPAGRKKSTDFAFPVWLIPILIQIIQALFKPKTLAAAKLPKAPAKAKSAAKKLEKYIACEGRAA